MKKIGFTIGKFAPFHKGHQYLIETALAECDEFYVVVYETDVISVDVKTRAKWIKDLYPEVHILYGLNPPGQYGLDKDSVEIQMKYLSNIIKDIHPTTFYSSEPYGKCVAEYLNIEDRQVDKSRIKYPISGTMVRENIEKHKMWLHLSVYNHIKRFYS